MKVPYQINICHLMQKFSWITTVIDFWKKKFLQKLSFQETCKYQPAQILYFEINNFCDGQMSSSIICPDKDLMLK